MWHTVLPTVILIILLVLITLFLGVYKRANRVKALALKLSRKKKDLPNQPSEDAVARALKGLENTGNRGLFSGFSNQLLASGYEGNPIIILGGALLSNAALSTLVYVTTSAKIFVILTVVAGVALPFIMVKHLAQKRTKLFLEDFGPSLDVIIRGLRNGLSIVQAIKMIAEEGAPTVSSEFQKMFNDLEFGLSMSEAVNRLCDRIDAPEVRFFAIVIGIQSKSGGNLSSSLENLSDLLKKRKEMKGKIKALSSEAKTSAWIIGALPVLVVIVVSVFSPDYTAVLFETVTGNLILGGCIVWMSIGIFVMSQMIKLEE